jgi:hypothetical protein
VGYAKNWFNAFLQWSFLQVSAYGYLFIFEGFLRRYITTLPVDIAPEHLSTYGFQAVVVAIIFVCCIPLVMKFNSGLFSGGNSATVLDLAPMRRYV